MSVLFFTKLLEKGRNLRHTVMVSSELYSCVADSNNKLQSTRWFLNTAFCGNLGVYKPLDTRTVQPVATCRQSPYVHKPAIVKLLLLIYGFKFRSAFIYWACVDHAHNAQPATPTSVTDTLPSPTHSWTHLLN